MFIVVCEMSVLKSSITFEICNFVAITLLIIIFTSSPKVQTAQLLLSGYYQGAIYLCMHYWNKHAYMNTSDIHRYL